MRKGGLRFAGFDAQTVIGSAKRASTAHTQSMIILALRRCAAQSARTQPATGPAAGGRKTPSMASVVGRPFNASRHRWDNMRENRAFATLICFLVGCWCVRPRPWWQWAAIVTAFVLLQRRMVRGTFCRSARDLSGKLVVITGASSGIGAHTAITLATRHNATVVGSCRSQDVDEEKRKLVKLASGYGGEKAQAAVERLVTLYPLELTSWASIDDFCRKVRYYHLGTATETPEASQQDATRRGGIFALVNNAGAIQHTFKQTDQQEEYMTVANFVGPVRLTETLLPCLEPAAAEAVDDPAAVVAPTPSGRIINVTSGSHLTLTDPNVGALLPCPSGTAVTQVFNFMNRYVLSKLCNIYHADYLAEKGYLAVSVNPGGVASGIFRSAMPNLSGWYPLLTCLVLKTSHEGAQTLVHCVTADDLVPGGLYTECKLRLHAKSPVACNSTSRQSAMVWAFEKMGHVKPLSLPEGPVKPK